MPIDPKALAERITEYLSAGGLWNPELMSPEKVRDLLIDCRDALLQAADVERETAEECARICESIRGPHQVNPYIDRSATETACDDCADAIRWRFKVTK